MPKKTSTAKKKATKTPAKRGPGRPKGSTNKKTSAKKTPAKNVKKPASKRGGNSREMNPDTGFAVGTDQDVIANALLEGGESRLDVAERVKGLIDNKTRNGSEKMIVNMVSGVLSKMLARGFTVEQSFVVNPPTPASKRAATRAATKKTAAKKPVAKKTAAKRGPGRPKGSKNVKAARKSR